MEAWSLLETQVQAWPFRPSPTASHMLLTYTRCSIAHASPLYRSQPLTAQGGLVGQYSGTVEEAGHKALLALCDRGVVEDGALEELQGAWRDAGEVACVPMPHPPLVPVLLQCPLHTPS